ncbi:meiotic recombination protein REC8 homolog isoform X1 [Penaeus vannamei]|uniref:meiotic recombination protein REC8 homolog isoform X1 n=1 Tax=Penaeus vannamei TaxID=6689 RepID=UPI00387F81B2
MFYSYDVLHPRKGKLAVVWLAATGRLQFKKRQDRNFKEAMSVKIYRTCDEILRYVVLKKVTSVGDEKGRFSLYLSSMLMYGTVMLYRRQVRFLLDEVMGTYQKLQHQRALLLDLDTSSGGPLRVTMREPSMADYMNEDWTLLTLPSLPSLDTSVTTPRKRDTTSTPVSAEIETMRLEVHTEFTGDIDAHTLLGDWIETPTRARPEDITLRDLSTTNTQPFALQIPELQEEQALGPIDLGPPFLLEGPLAELPLDPTLESVTRQLDLSGQDTTGKKSEEEPEKRKSPEKEQMLTTGEQELSETPQPVDKQTEDKHMEDQILPHVEETPSGQPTVPHAEIKRKHGAPEPTIEETPAVAPQAPPTRPVDTSDIHLEPVEGPKTKRGRKKRKARRLIIDDVTQISRENIREQATSFQDTMRHQLASEDKVHIHWFQKIIPTSQLLIQVSHRPKMAGALKALLSRGYHSDPNKEHWDFQHPVRRQLQLPDESVEGARFGLSIVSEDTLLLPDVSSLLSSNLESSRTSASRSLLRTPNVSQIEPVQQEPVQLLPIQEEQIEAERQSVSVDQVLPLQQQPQVDHPAVENLDMIQPIPHPVDQPPSATRTEAILSESAIPRPIIEVESIEVRHVDEVPKTSRDAHKEHYSKTTKLVSEDIRAATPPGAYPAVRSHMPPPSTPSPRRPIQSPQVACEVVTVQADVHHIPAHMDRTSAGPVSLEDLEIFPMPATGEFEVQEVAPQLINGGQLPEEAFQSEAQQQPCDVPLPYKPVGPLIGEESFIPGTITPIKHPSAPPRIIETPDPSQLSHLDTEKKVLNIIDKHTSGIHITFTDLLPEEPTRKSVVSVFSTLLELHKKRLLSLIQEENYDVIYIERL